MMKISNSKLADIVLSSFEEAYKTRNDNKLKDNNPLRSSYFVSLIGNELEKHYQNAKVHYQKVDKITKEKKSGEWLFDICVTTQKKLNERESSTINTSILFACESEFSTLTSDFAKDFGKLICSNAKQILYINGLSQDTPEKRKAFIEKRKKLIKEELSAYIRNDFVLAFIPTPKKIKTKSFWDAPDNQNVLSYVNIWIYNAVKKEFIEHLSTLYDNLKQSKLHSKKL